MGKIITIEGIDGCGKQTQALKLYNRLKEEGYKVIEQSLPNYESISSGPVKMYLSGEFGDDPNILDAYQSSLLFAVDRLCTVKKLQSFYDDNGIIIFDRYVQSNMIHQAGKIDDLKKRDAFLDWLNDLEFNKIKLPQSDEVIFLDIPVRVSQKLANSRTLLKSGEKKDIHEIDKKHLEKSYEAGKYVAQKYNWDIINCIDQNDNLKTVEEIHEQIYNLVKKNLFKESDFCK